MLDILAAAGGTFDVETATRAYLDTLQGPARAKSDAYFEGGYWLILWGAVVSVLIDWLFLKFRLTHAFRRFAESKVERPSLITGITALGYIALGWLVTLPWAIYTGFWREQQYGLLDQPFGAWFTEQAIGFVISLIVGPLIVMAIYAVIRRAPRTWWLWSTGVLAVFMGFAMVLSPVFIAPLFNEYTELEDGPLRDRIVSIAADYDIPAENIYVFDQSKQHKRISANVSGLGPTIRISLNDNLLERTSEEEILAVMGHEMGHYKLNHIWWIMGIMLTILGLGLFVTSRAGPWLIARYGERWGVREMADPASLPVLAICLALWMFAMTPATNSLIRWAESHADAFGLESAKEPDGFAKVAMRLSEYRKIEPSPLEEMLFFDHPSGETRVRMAMEWKAANMDNPQIVVPEEGYLDAPEESSPTK